MPKTGLFQKVKSDKEKPTASCSMSGKKATVSGNDGSGSGISKYYIKFSTSSSKPSSTSGFSSGSSDTVDATCGNKYYAYAYVEDNVGNVSGIVKCSGHYQAPSCVNKYYLCRNDCDHGTNSKYDDLSWTQIHHSASFGNESGIAYGKNRWVKWTSKSGNFRLVSDVQTHTGTVANKYIYKGCITSSTTSSDCADTCRG